MEVGSAERRDLSLGIGPIAEAALLQPIIRSKNPPFLNIQNRKILVLSGNTLSYASR